MTNNCQILGNVFEDNSDWGLYVEGNNHIISDNIATFNGSDFQGGGFYIAGNDNWILRNMSNENMGMGMQVSGNRNHVRENTLSGNGSTGLVVIGNNNDLRDIISRMNGGVLASTGVIIGGDNNYLWRITASRNVGIGFWVGGKNNQIRQVTATANEGAGLILSGENNRVLDSAFTMNYVGIWLGEQYVSEIRGNTITGNFGGEVDGEWLDGDGIVISESSENALIRDNSIIGNFHDGVYIDPLAGGGHVISYNNIIQYQANDLRSRFATFAGSQSDPASQPLGNPLPSPRSGCCQPQGGDL